MFFESTQKIFYINCVYMIVYSSYKIEINYISTKIVLQQIWINT